MDMDEVFDLLEQRGEAIIFISQADKEGEHGTFHTRTIERPACGAWLTLEQLAEQTHLVQVGVGQL